MEIAIVTSTSYNSYQIATNIFKGTPHLLYISTRACTFKPKQFHAIVQVEHVDSFPFLVNYWVKMYESAGFKVVTELYNNINNELKEPVIITTNNLVYHIAPSFFPSK